MRFGTGGLVKAGGAFLGVLVSAEIVDANTASVVSSSLGIPIMTLTAGKKEIADGVTAVVNQQQLDQQQPNIRDLVRTIE